MRFSPSNFLFDQPGSSFARRWQAAARILVRGMRMLAEDISGRKGRSEAPAVRCHELRGRTEHRDDAPAR